MNPDIRYFSGPAAFTVRPGEKPVFVYRPPLTLKLLAEKLVGLEKELGFERVAVLVESLDYSKLCDLARLSAGENDPALMPSRFLLLDEAADYHLKEKGRLDSLPYSVLVPEAAVFSVGNLCRFLAFAGYLGPVVPGPFEEANTADEDEGDDEEFLLAGDNLEALTRYLAQAAEPLDSLKLKGHAEHTVTEEETLSSIASLYGIRSFRLLWELNREVLGEDWDRPKPGTVLKLPDPADNPLRDWLAENGWEEYCPDRPGKGYQFPGKYLSLTLTDGEGKPIGTLDPPAKCEVYCTGPKAPLLYSFPLSSGEIDLMVPDCPFELHVQGFNLLWNGRKARSRAEYLAQESGARGGRAGDGDGDDDDESEAGSDREGGYEEGFEEEPEAQPAEEAYHLNRDEDHHA